MSSTRPRGARASGSSNGRTVLVLGNYRPALAAAHALYTMGYRVVLGAEPGSTGAERSRFVDHVWPLPDARLAPAEFRAALAARLQSDRTIAVIVPMTERLLNLVDASRDVVPPEVRVAAPQSSVLRVCHDKLAWLRFCRAAGIATPPFEAASSLPGLRRTVEAIGCPVVIRPVEAGTRIGKRKAVLLDRLDDLGAAFPTWPAGVGELLVQKRFQGERYNLYFGALDGTIVRQLHSYSLRTDRWDGSGQTIEGAVVPPIGLHGAMLAKAAAGLGYTGIGCAQFLYDRATGESCFLEINPRFGASYVFVERAGFELTRLALELAEPNPSPRPLQAPIRPVRFVWTYGDLSGLFFSLRSRDVTIGQAIRWAAASVRAAVTADVHVTWSWADPLPTIGFYWDQLLGVFGPRRAAGKADGVDFPASTRSARRPT